MKIKLNFKTCLVLVGLTICVTLFIELLMQLIGMGGVNESMKLVNTAKQNRDILFAETIDGTMMHVPVSENEAIAESTGTNGSKGYYMFTRLGDCVTITDDILISQQQSLYDMMLSMLDSGVTVVKDDCYVTTIRKTDKIMQLMVKKWGLTEGQTMGALNNYGATETDNTHLELIVKPNNVTHFEFAINLYVEDKAYAIYNGISLANDAEKSIPHQLYDYRKLEGISTSDERAKEYLTEFTDYFKEIAVLITDSTKEVN